MTRRSSAARDAACATTPETVARRRVFDARVGAGLCAIAAMVAGATDARRRGIDPVRAGGDRADAKADERRVESVRRDASTKESPPDDARLILVGDCW